MGQRVCPWWLGYLLASPLRRLLEDPNVLRPFVHEGMTVLEPGPGMGFFTLELARLVGPRGRVIAVDIQPKMLSSLERRARRAGLQDRIETRLSLPESIQVPDLAGMVDFTLAYAVVHELPSVATFFAEVAAASKPGAKLFLVEPAGHVTAPDFDREIEDAARAGFKLLGRPALSRRHAALFERGG